MARILVLGGYGVFGGRLARRLIRETGAEILVAGRSLRKAEAFCRQHGGSPVELDRDGDVAASLTRLRPEIVVDAAGPFQGYGENAYRVARAAIDAGAHYLDLADDAVFVAGIAVLDGAAKSAGVAVLSGASSVPAISSAAADALVEGLSSVSLVSTAILPGNRAPRGVSVMRAIVGQVGRPLAAWRGGRWTEAPAWGDLSRVALRTDGVRPLEPRLASRIGAPDLILFPERYKARSVEFRAGLELRTLHIGLWALGWLVRAGAMRSLLPLVPALKFVADRLEDLGSDRGGMLVRAVGCDAAGDVVERCWTLIADGGDGPEIPPTPALLLCRKLLAGRDLVAGSADRPSALAAGAYPAVGVLTLDEIEAGLMRFAVRCGKRQASATPLLEQVLAGEAVKMPPAWRRLAAIADLDNFAGEASVERGSGWLSRLAGGAFGFPPTATSVKVEVTKEKTAKGETWTRRFNGRPFVSHLSRRADDGPGVLRERFGPFSFVMRLVARDGRVEWPTEAWRFLGVPMPAWLRPRSETAEFIDGQGRFNFDVGISLPLAGPIVRYRGWLTPLDGGSSPEAQDDSVSGSSASAPRSIQA